MDDQDLMADAKRQTEIIDALNQAIAANIQAIVDEGGKAGEGVNQLGRAIVTSLTLEQKPADKGAKPATSQEIAKETDQQTQYMISGLEALSSGIAGSSQAARELKTNTDKLAQAYQALAATVLADTNRDELHALWNSLQKSSVFLWTHT